MKLIIDVDGTICTNTYGDYENAKPYPARIQKLNRLYDEGHEIHYWTARGSSSGLDWTELTHKQIKQWGCKYHTISLGKPSYDMWVDDKAFNSETYFLT
jgi:hypothetical protein